MRNTNGARFQFISDSYRLSSFTLPMGFAVVSDGDISGLGLGVIVRLFPRNENSSVNPRQARTLQSHQSRQCIRIFVTRALV